MRGLNEACHVYCSRETNQIKTADDHDVANGGGHLVGNQKNVIYQSSYSVDHRIISCSLLRNYWETPVKLKQ